MDKSKQQQSKHHQQDDNKPAKPAQQGSDAAHQPSGEIEGEGSYTASKDYDKSVKAFVESGKVDQASHDAAPRNDTEAREMKRAEDIGRSRAKEEDPEVSQPHVERAVTPDPADRSAKNKHKR